MRFGKFFVIYSLEWFIGNIVWKIINIANLAQLGERQTEDLKVPGSIPGVGKLFALSK